MKLEQNIFEFDFSFEDVELTNEELISAMGYSINNVPDYIKDTVTHTVQLLKSHSKPKGGFVILFGNEIKIERDRFYINNTCINSEKIITRYFKKTEYFAILLATIGSQAEALSKEFINHNDLLMGYSMDIASSELVEKTIALVELKLDETVRKLDLGTTNRYSPGYCGWDVSDQHKLFSFLPDNFCGITLNNSAMMIPIKSVSAMVGIGKNAVKEEYECEICDIDFCYKRDRKKLSL